MRRRLIALAFFSFAIVLPAHADDFLSPGSLSRPPVIIGNTRPTSVTGTGGVVVLQTSPLLITPNLGTPSAGVATNLTGTASGLTAGTVTTNANLTGVITSVGNATSIASQTGTGTKFVVDTGATIGTPTINTPTISGGTIDNNIVGGTTAVAGTFTTLNSKVGNSSTNARAGGQLTPQLTPAGTPANTNKTTLQTISLPANSFDANGRCIKIEGWGTFANNGNTKTVTLDFGTGNTIYTSTALTSALTNWVVWGTVCRTGSGTQSHYATGIFQNASPFTGVGTDAQTDSGAIPINLTGQNGSSSASDIVANGLRVDIIN